jgi:hypothetical protein
LRLIHRILAALIVPTSLAACSALLGLPDEHSGSDAEFPDAAQDTSPGEGRDATAEASEPTGRDPVDAGSNDAAPDRDTSDANAVDCVYPDALPHDNSACAPLVTCGVPQGAATFAGSIKGYNLDIVEATAYRDYRDGAHQIYIDFTDFTNACGYWSSRWAHAKGGHIRLRLYEPTTATATDFKVGAFSAGGDRWIGVAAHIDDAKCTGAAITKDDEWATGSVSFTAIAPDRAKGTFDLQLGSDHLTGSFDAPLCGYEKDQSVLLGCCEGMH